MKACFQNEKTTRRKNNEHNNRFLEVLITDENFRLQVPNRIDETLINAIKENIIVNTSIFPDC